MQANAEPDLQQTGERLKPIIDGLVEGIMQLVVDPLAQSKVIHLVQCHTFTSKVGSCSCLSKLSGRKHYAARSRPVGAIKGNSVWLSVTI